MISSASSDCGIDAVLADALRNVGDADAAAGEGKRVVNEHGVAAFGDLVGPGDAAVVVLLMCGDDRPGIVVDAGDFSPAEEFVAAVIVQGEDGGQAAGAIGGLEEDGFGSRAAGKLPGEAFDDETVEFVRRFDGHLRLAAQIDRGHAFPDAGSRGGAPLVERFPFAGAERKPGRGHRRALFRRATGHRRRPCFDVAWVLGPLRWW